MLTVKGREVGSIVVVVGALKALMINQVGTLTRKGKSGVNVQLLGSVPWIRSTMYPTARDKLVADFNYGQPNGHEFPQTHFLCSGDVIHLQLRLEDLGPKRVSSS